MTRRPSPEALRRIAGAALVGSVSILAWVGWDAARLDAVPTAPSAAQGVHAALHVPPLPSIDSVLSAAGPDPFDPERRDRPGRFAFGDEAPAALPSRVEAVRLVGTAVLPGGGFALCSVGREPAAIVRPGEVVGHLVLESIGPGSAVFRTTDGGRITLTVLEQE